MSYLVVNSLDFSNKPVDFALMLLTKLELISVSSWICSSFLMLWYWVQVKTMIVIYRYLTIWTLWIRTIRMSYWSNMVTNIKENVRNRKTGTELGREGLFFLSLNFRHSCFRLLYFLWRVFMSRLVNIFTLQDVAI